HRVEHQRWRFLLYQIGELAAELLHRYVGGRGEARQLVRIVEVVAPQPDHVTAAARRLRRSARAGALRRDRPRIGGGVPPPVHLSDRGGTATAGARLGGGARSRGPRVTRVPVVQVRRLPHHDGLPLPTRQTAGSAGYDVHSAEPDFTLSPLERRLVRTGLALAIPDGYEAQVRPRSGLALKHGLTLPNAPATIDSDYRGE